MDTTKARTGAHFKEKKAALSRGLAGTFRTPEVSASSTKTATASEQQVSALW
jgi:hypothetical protein